MPKNRRHFVASAAGVGSLLMLSCKTSAGSGALADKPGPDAPSTLRVRRSLMDLDPNGPEVTDYRKAVAAMRALPASDNRSWAGQAEIHFNSCPHGNWFFLPWHRAYLHHFERMIQKFSGNPNFSLPYWDWTRTPTIPPAFADQSNDNPLYNATRVATGQLREQDVGPEVVKRIMATSDFFSFGSSRAATQRAGAPSGILEGTPHNSVHNWINGDMGSFRSPIDPIFWLHHANVDRLWAEWSLQHAATSLPDNPAPTDRNAALTRDFWLQFQMGGYFDDENLSAVALVAETLTTNGYGYTYDTIPAAGAGLADAVARAPRTELVLGASKQSQVVRSAQVVTFTMPVTQAMRDAYAGFAAADAAGPSSAQIRLIASEIPLAAGKQARFRVFLNHPSLTPATPDGGVNFVGRYAFFGDNSAGHEGHGGLTRAINFDVTANFKQLFKTTAALGTTLTFQVQILTDNNAEQPAASYFTGIKLSLEFVKLA